MKVKSGIKAKTEKFFKLKSGDVFKAFNSVVFIKTDVHVGTNNVNSVRVGNGTFEYFSADELVEPLDAELIVYNSEVKA